MENVTKQIVQRHPKSNRDMALQVCKLCDTYWESKITELLLVADLQYFFTTYPELIWDEDGQVNGTVIHKLGKKRMKLIHTVSVNMQLNFNI